MARRKGTGVPVKGKSGKTSVVNMRSVPKAPRMKAS